MADGVRKDEEFSAPKRSRAHRIDVSRLSGWMAENVEGFQGPLTVLQFKGGQSNPTYRLDTPGRSYDAAPAVGKLPPSAHAVDRESASSQPQQAGLSGREGLCACTDDGVIGSSSSCRWKRGGAVDPLLPSQTPGDRRKIFTSKIETLAKLHQFELTRSARRLASPAIILRAGRSLDQAVLRLRPSTFRIR